MLVDVNCWLGHWPYRRLRDRTAEELVARLDYLGVTHALVSSIDSILYRNVQPANEDLAEALAPYGDRLFPVATINPNYAGWEDDLDAAAERLCARGVRLIPQYHGYDLDSPAAQRAAAACAERGLPVLVAHRIEDPRQRHHLDPGQTVGFGAAAALLRAVPNLRLIITNARGLFHSDFVRDPGLRDKAWYVDLSLAEVDYQLHRHPADRRDLGRALAYVGPAHLLFGTHLPFSYGAPALVKFETLELSEADRASIRFRTAARLFALPIP